MRAHLDEFHWIKSSFVHNELKDNFTNLDKEKLNQEIDEEFSYHFK